VKDRADAWFDGQTLHAKHRREKRRRRTEQLRKRKERERVKRLLRQLTNSEIDESFEYAINKPDPKH
jgi:hypothetical protein